MKIYYYLLLLFILSSCKEDILNNRYRNENYVFYQENGKDGEWRKIDPDLKMKFPKSHSTYFFPNGNKYAEVEVLDSFPNRIVKFYNKEDKLTRTTKFESDTAVNTIYVDGFYKEYHSNIGLLKSQGIFENNLYQGKWEFYRKDGKTIRQTVEYVNDIPNGIREDYWENGQLEFNVNYVNGKQNGKVVHYYESGELEEVAFLKNGKFHGRLKSYYKNGNLKYDRNYWNDKKIDTCISFFKSGKIQIFQTIKIDTNSRITTGKQYRYYESGELHKESNTKNDLPDGILTTYYKNGVIKSWQEVKANKINGKFITYYSNGTMKKKGKALNNVLKDTLFHFKENGNPERTYIMENGFIKDSIIY